MRFGFQSNNILYTVLRKSERYFHLQNNNEMFTKLYAKFSAILTNLNKFFLYAIFVELWKLLKINAKI